MRNPWRMQDGPDNKINRNNFPMSFQYNGTFKYGKIYPIGLWRTIPGASYQIDSTLALNFMPTSFPIQTRQRAYVHFFYGRDRNFWKDYKDFVNGMNPDLVKPYLDESVTKARTGNLLDYLGVPTTIVGSYGNYVNGEITFNDGYLGNPHYLPSTPNYSWRVASFYDDLVGQSWNNFSPNEDEGSNLVNCVSYPITIPTSLPITESNVKIQIVPTNLSGFTVLDDFMNESQNGSLPRYQSIHLVVVEDDNIVYDIRPSKYGNNGQAFFDFDYSLSETSSCYIIFTPLSAGDSTISLFTSTSSSGNGGVALHLPQLVGINSISILNDTVKSIEVRDIDETTSPYWRSGATTDLRTRIKLNAIPCRMYETIYNLYYRNPQNNPYILNGKPEYNVFIPTKDGGVDDNLYELRYRNWEDDFLTTAVQTPQQGIAPLVGLTDRGATVTLTNEDGSVTRYKTNLDENGNVTGIETTDSSEPLLTQALIDAVSYGISIEDLRNVNAMQKWLELNLRKGYQYKDIIEARWGISISYNELDLPEFIGGFTQEVGLQAVTQTTSHGDTIEGALGWQAGRMYAAGSGLSIQHYCEEEGYIMALLCVVPVPNYSQLLPKHWFTRDLLDSYQPEFNHIGFQPITYKEVCPIQAYQESTENVDVLEQTFGYQRPWYEYFNQVDEVHGQFRTTFKDFLINRTFDVKPELSESFLLVDPNQINDVFAVTTDDDKIIGAINHQITAKLPISLYAQARLE